MAPLFCGRLRRVAAPDNNVFVLLVQLTMVMTMVNYRKGRIPLYQAKEQVALPCSSTGQHDHRSNSL